MAVFKPARHDKGLKALPSRGTRCDCQRWLTKFRVKQNVMEAESLKPTSGRLTPHTIGTRSQPSTRRALRELPRRGRRRLGAGTGVSAAPCLTLLQPSPAAGSAPRLPFGPTPPRCPQASTARPRGCAVCKTSPRRSRKGRKSGGFQTQQTPSPSVAFPPLSRPPLFGAGVASGSPGRASNAPGRTEPGAAGSSTPRAGQGNAGKSLSGGRGSSSSSTADTWEVG